VDGCWKGWFYFGLGDGPPEYGVVSTLGELMERVEPSVPVFVDIPIGLLSQGRGERSCDLEARRLLSPGRSSSVFPTPSRPAVYAGSYEESQQRNREALGKGLSKQSWGIVPRIREVDELLLASPEVRGQIREVHPEVCFRGLVGAPMVHSKKTRAGINARLDALERHIPQVRRIVGEAYLEHGGFEAQRDDILDALVAAVCAVHAADCVTIPASPPLDDVGIPMEMVYWPAADLGPPVQPRGWRNRS